MNLIDEVKYRTSNCTFTFFLIFSLLRINQACGSSTKEIKMWFVGIGAILILLKLGDIGPFGDLSWWWVALPLGCAIAWWSYADSTGYYQKKAMEKMDQKRKDRVTKNLVSLGIDAQRKRKR